MSGKPLVSLLLFLIFSSICFADTKTDQPALLIGDNDGTNAGRYRSLKFTNGATTNNGDGSVSVSSSGGSGTVGVGTTGVLGVYTGTTTIGPLGTPTACSAGNYARGIDNNGNAVSCTAAGGASSNFWLSGVMPGNFGIGTVSPYSVGIGTLFGNAALSVMSVGNVGFGTWNPTSALQVIGTINGTTVQQGGVGVVTTARQITVAGTSNQITSSAGAQDLSADRTWTLSTPQDIATSSSVQFGNVGINTTLTNNRLSVNGGASFGDTFAGVVIPTGQVGIKTNLGIGTYAPTKALCVGSTCQGSIDSSGNGILGGTIAVTGHATFEGVTSTGATGTGKFVFDGTPTLVTPVLGTATATTINKVTLTQPSSSATLTIADTKTLAATQTVSLDTMTDAKWCSYSSSGTSLHCDNNAPGAGTSQWITYGQAGNVGIGTKDTVGIGTTLGSAGLSIINGNVGIGTWNPVTALEIVGRLKQSVTPTACSAGNYPLGIDGNLNVVSCTAAGGGSSQWLTYGQAGNVGIGTKDTVGIGTTLGSAGLAVMNGNIGMGSWNPEFGLVIAVGGAKITGTGTSNFTSNVGISSAAPGTALDVNGFIRSTSLTGTKCVQTDATGTLTSAAAACGSGSGTSQWNTLPGVGIGTSEPVGIGTFTFSSKLTIMGNVGVGTNGSSLFITTAAPNGGMIIEKNVGIGSLAPGATLDVNGSGRFAGSGNGYVQSLGGNFGIGTTLSLNKLDVAGSVGIGTAYAGYQQAANNDLIVYGNIGIGTWKPAARLEVRGTATGSVKSGANTACNTTCGSSSCLLGEDTSVIGTIVACTDATADICVCLGP